MGKARSRRRDAGRERHWREVIRAQGRSGQSVRAYCRGAGVKEATFYWWRRELARRSEAEKAAGAKSQKPGAATPTPGGATRKPSRPTGGRKSARLSTGRRPARPAASQPTRGRDQGRSGKRAGQLDRSKVGKPGGVAARAAARRRRSCRSTCSATARPRAWRSTWAAGG